MRVRIHRGAHEIGGTCIELAVAGKHLVLDLGRPLSAAPGEAVTLPDIAGLSAPNGRLVGVALSHPHEDHYGLADQVHRSVPVYIGKAAASLLDAAAFFSPAGIRVRPARFLVDRVPFTLGPFTVTPYLVDHSAFDSYALLVDGGGRRLFYSGDFRTHGRKRALMRTLFERPPEDIDVLFLEGTHIRRDDSPTAGLDEFELELALTKQFRSTAGLVVVFTSTQNIDRLVTVYRACRRAERTLVLDLYGATVARATGRETIPGLGFPGVSVYVPRRQRVLVKRARAFERMEAIAGQRIFPESIRQRSDELVVLIQGSTLAELAEARCLEGATAIWSLWPGYLDGPSGQRVLSLLDVHGVPLAVRHASGHAHIHGLQALASALTPARVIPIHTSAPERFDRYFKCVEVHDDGEWWCA
jgi:ribonuclease J